MPQKRQVGEWAAGGLPIALTGRDGHDSRCSPQVGEGH